MAAGNLRNAAFHSDPPPQEYAVALSKGSALVESGSNEARSIAITQDDAVCGETESAESVVSVEPLEVTN